MSQQKWPLDQHPPFFGASGAFDLQQPDLTMSIDAPLDRENISEPAGGSYIPNRDVDTTALEHRAPQGFFRYSEGLQTSGNLQGPGHHPLFMPVPHRPITHVSRSDEGISCSGHSLPIGAAQSSYLPFGPPHSTESNLILPPRPRGPISLTLDGGTNELSRSLAPGSGHPRHEHFDLAGSAATPDSRQANWTAHNPLNYFDPSSLTVRHEINTTALGNHLLIFSSPHYGRPLYHSGEEMPPNGGGGRIVYPRMNTDTQFQAPGSRTYPLGTSAHESPTTQTSDLLLAIDQHSPSFPSPSYPASIPNYLRSSIDSSHDFEISPPPQPREPDSTTFGMRESIARWASHASGRPQHENFGQGVSSIAIEPAGPIGQQPRKLQDATNRNPCNLCKHWHVRCVVVADELGFLCEQCKKKGVKCEFQKK